MIFLLVSLLLVFQTNSQTPDITITWEDLQEALTKAQGILKTLKEQEQYLLDHGHELPKGSAAHSHHISTKASKNTIILEEKFGRYFELITTQLVKKLGLRKDEIPVIQNLNLESLASSTKDEDGSDYERSNSVPAQSSNVLQPRKYSNVKQLLKECKEATRILCAPFSKYRTVDGVCNNVKNPNWGKAGGCVNRLLLPVYEDVIQKPPRSYDGSPLPNPRIVSTTIHRNLNKPDSEVTQLFMTFGQFLSHDITETPAYSIVTSGGDLKSISCCSSEKFKHPECLPIDISNDRFYSVYNQTCHNFVRSAACTTCKLGFRESMNEVTSYVDASIVYGQSHLNGEEFRKFKNGTMIEGELHLLPSGEYCNPNVNLKCFKSADGRANEHLGLTSMHVIWMRLHNRIAEQLQHHCSEWTDEEIFQETKRIVGAMLQVIAYKEYLPVLLGPEVVAAYSLEINNPKISYNDSVDASVLNSFATTAFRFGHSSIQNTIRLKGQRLDEELPINLLFSFPFHLYREPELVGASLRGMAMQPQQSVDGPFADGVTNFLFRNPYDLFGLDLASINIQRARERGIPSYSVWYQYCFGSNFQSFDDLRSVMTEDNIQRLKLVYKHVQDIDLYTGGLLENHVENGIVGPTFACIIAIQFQRLKFGDRFYFEFTDQIGSFSSDQILELKKTSLSSIICAATDVETMQINSFLSPNKRNPLLPCSYFSLPDFILWKNEKTEVAETCGGINRFPNFCFVSPVSDWPGPIKQNCSVTHILGDEYCKLRIEIVDLKLIGKPSGSCNEQSFMVTDDEQLILAPMCGKLNGQTIEVKRPQVSAGPVVLTIATNLIPLPERWRIEIDAIEC